MKQYNDNAGPFVGCVRTYRSSDGNDLLWHSHVAFRHLCLHFARRTLEENAQSHGPSSTSFAVDGLYLLSRLRLLVLLGGSRIIARSNEHCGARWRSLGPNCFRILALLGHSSWSVNARPTRCGDAIPSRRDAFCGWCSHGKSLRFGGTAGFVLCAILFGCH